jgi:predicted DNA-binding transcriptional regulator YafY
MKETPEQIRMRKVIEYIHHHPGCTTRQIADTISAETGHPVTLRTIQNYLRYLREEWRDGKLISTRGRHTIQDYRIIPQRGIEEQPRIFLKLALEALENLSDLSDEYQNLIKKLNLETLQNPFYIKPEEYEHLNTDEEELKDLHFAINNDTVIAFAYRGRDFHVEPYRLVSFDGIWYLYGRDIEEKEENDHKTWLLSDIDDVEVFHGDRHDTPDEEIEEDLKEAYSPAFVPDRHFSVTVRIAPEVTELFTLKKHLPRQHTIRQEADGSLLVRATVSTYEDIDPEIKSWLPHIEIIEPASYRETFLRELEAYLERYQTP